MAQLPNFKPSGVGYDSLYNGINNKRPTKSDRGNQDLQNSQNFGVYHAYIEQDRGIQKIVPNLTMKYKHPDSVSGNPYIY